eukprot:3201068-Prymnesium_polylepis.1
MHILGDLGLQWVSGMSSTRKGMYTRTAQPTEEQRVTVQRVRAHLDRNRSSSSSLIEEAVTTLPPISHCEESMSAFKLCISSSNSCSSIWRQRTRHRGRLGLTQCFRLRCVHDAVNVSACGPPLARHWPPQASAPSKRCVR